MAPVGMVSMTGWFTAPEVGIISLIVFLILSITLVALCNGCKRSSGNAYDVNSATTDGGAGANGTAGTKSGVTNPDFVTWRNHADMPPSTLDRARAVTN
ncbi:hypothetical protein D4764_19G0001060 [Takifugu flavidus]|uniref:Uncharacterized protein n=1 Tax=Takifugu flavidus TaxID=433684 RepID=A0A5C6NNL1_9TELE|nr:hypothetical protein D4764_19G0001060 [Takifugu flavidus]